jgi:hypothetical protein
MNPGAALFLGCTAEHLWLKRRQVVDAASRNTGRKDAVFCGLLLAGVALGWGIYNTWVVPRQEQGWPYQRLGQDIRSRTHMPVIFFRAEAHLLAFHVGRPLDTILEWENLDVWASRKVPVYFVMPPDCAADWPKHLAKGQLEETFRTSDHSWGKRERPLVVMRSRP